MDPNKLNPPATPPIPPLIIKTSLFNWKSVLIGLAFLVSITVGAFWMGRQSIKTSTLSVTPTMIQIQPSTLPSQTPMPSTIEISPTEVAKQVSCQTDADCSIPKPTCQPKLIEMYGNESHCPIPRCFDGECKWLPVP